MTRLGWEAGGLAAGGDWPLPAASDSLASGEGQIVIPDKNIDHRRVPNLMRYFERHHIAMKEKLRMPESYRPGDLVAWDLGGGILHIGVVSDKQLGRTPWIIHNIGRGTVEEDLLLKFRVIGHYRVNELPQPSVPVSRSQPIRSETIPTTSAARFRR